MIGETLVEAVSLIDQVTGVHSEQVQEGGVKVVDADSLVHCLVANFVGGPVDVSRFDPTACHPNTALIGTMVAARGSSVPIYL